MEAKGREHGTWYTTIVTEEKGDLGKESLGGLQHGPHLNLVLPTHQLRGSEIQVLTGLE